MAIPLIQNVEKQDINTSIIAIRRQLEQLYNALGVTENTVSSEDISKSTGTPLGTWASFENDYAPNIEWLQGGATFNPNTYPALAMYLGGNTVPERFDHSRLGEVESISISTNPSNPNVAEYDGILYVGLGVNGSRKLWINGVMFGCVSGSDGGADSYELKKGDVFYGNSGINFAKIAYYKHPLFIKATPTSSDSDYEGTLNAIREFYVRNNTYSTEETLTGGVWIDGKPIYRKVVKIYNQGSLVSGITHSSSSFYHGFPFLLTAELITNCWVINKRQDNYVDIYNAGASGAQPIVPKVGIDQVYLSIPNAYTFWAVFEYTKTTDV